MKTSDNKSLVFLLPAKWIVLFNKILTLREFAVI